MSINSHRCLSFCAYLEDWFSRISKQLQIVIITTLLLCSLGAGYLLASFSITSQFHVYYSLDQKNNDQQIIRLINNADKYVYFAIYYFTKNNIADALIQAKKRGLVVWGITDNTASLESNKNVVENLRQAGITVETQKHQEGIMHMKVLVTDNAYASGSYNWTGSATTMNDEVLEVGTNESVRKQYLEIVKRVLVVNQ